MNLLQAFSGGNQPNALSYLMQRQQIENQARIQEQLLKQQLEAVKAKEAETSKGKDYLPFVLSPLAAGVSGALGSFGSLVNLIPDLTTNKKRNRLIDRLLSAGFKGDDKYFKDRLKEFDEKNPLPAALNKIPRIEDVRRTIDNLSGGKTITPEGMEGIDRIFEMAGSFVAPIPGSGIITSPIKTLKSIPKIPSKIWGATKASKEAIKNAWKIIPPKAASKEKILTLGEKLYRGLAAGTAQVIGETFTQNVENRFVKIGVPLISSILASTFLPKRLAKQAVSDEFSFYRKHTPKEFTENLSVGGKEMFNLAKTKVGKDFAYPKKGEILGTSQARPLKPYIEGFEKTAEAEEKFLKGKKLVEEQLREDPKEILKIKSENNFDSLKKSNRDFKRAEKDLLKIKEREQTLSEKVEKKEPLTREESKEILENLQKKRPLQEEKTRLKPLKEKYEEVKKEIDSLKTRIQTNKKALKPDGKFGEEALKDVRYSVDELSKFYTALNDTKKNLYGGQLTDISKSDKKAALYSVDKLQKGIKEKIIEILEGVPDVERNGKMVSLVDVFNQANASYYALNEISPIMNRTQKMIKEVGKYASIYVMANVKKLLPYAGIGIIGGGTLAVTHAIRNIRRITSDPILRSAFLGFLKATKKNQIGSAIQHARVISERIEKQDEKKGRFKSMGKMPDKIMKQYVK